MSLIYILSRVQAPYVIVEGLTYPNKKQLEDNMLVVYWFSLGRSSVIVLSLFSGHLILSRLFFGDKALSYLYRTNQYIL